MRTLLTLLILTTPIYAQQITFSFAGYWDHLPMHNYSVCSDTALKLPGNRVWAEAQRIGIAPQTRSELERRIQRRQKFSLSSLAKTGTLIAAGITTGLQAGGVIGDQWASGWKAIAPTAGTVLLVIQSLGNQQTKLEIPKDYLPPTMDIEAGGCAVGTIIGSP